MRARRRLPPKGRLAYRLYKLRASFWFLPGVMAAGAFAAAVASLAADALGASGALRQLGPPFDIQEDTARELLSTLSGAMVTVVSLVFSLTLVTLTLAAGNLGVRLLERYMQSRVTQVTMGLFVGTFVYSLLVLSSIGIDPIRVPALSVVLALVHALAAVGWLMFAFHDLARSLQVDQAAAAIAVSLRRQIDTAAAFASVCLPAADDELPAGAPRCAVSAGGAAGYVESIDSEALAAVASRHGVTLDLRTAQGEHLIPTDIVAVAHGAAEPADELVAAVRAAVTVGAVRTEADDPTFLLHLLVELAARALSPAVNDLYTAMACADHVTGVLAHAFERRLRGEALRGADGRLLVRTRSVDVPRLVEIALSGLRRNGMHNSDFALRLIAGIGRLAPVAAGDPAAPLILRHLQQIAAHAARDLPAVDRAAVEQAAALARKAFVPDLEGQDAGN